MGKLTKRERKFQASGGVKARIQKGTITKKGKLKKRRKASQPHQTPNKLASVAAPTSDKHHSDRDSPRPNDFLGPKNLSGLNIDSFFTEVSNQIEKGHLSDSEGTGSGSSDGDDDDREDSRATSPKERKDDSNDDSSESSSDEKDEKDDSSDDEPISKNNETESVSSSNDSESDDDSDDGDVVKAEARMKKEMSNMKKADPTFHKFLIENEESLLEFGDDDEDDAVREDEEDADEDVEEEGNQEDTPKTSTGDGTHLTPKVLKSLLQGAFESKGVRGLKKLVGAYKSACHLADSSPEGQTRTRPGESGKSYVIDSSKVFDQLMLECLNRCHEAFYYHLLGDKPSKAETDVDGEGSDENKPINPKTLEKSSKWDEVKPILLSFLRSTLHVISQAKEPELLTIILKAFSKYIPYLSQFPHIATAALRSFLQLWSAPLESSEDYQVVRLNAFLRIRQLSLTQPFPFIEECMKKTYLAYAKRAKFGASSSMTALPTLTFMGNCIVELYSLDYHSAYQHAFVYIRQLALLLRTALQKKSTEAIQQVYCWQFMYSLKLWVAVLSAAAPTDDGSAMKSLIYPLTEVILGTSRLSPSPRYLPLRFQCVRLVHQLSAASETFVPVSSLLLDCLDFKEWHLAPKKTRNAPRTLQMELLLKLPSTDQQACLRTQEQMEPAMNELFLLLQHEIELYRYSPGFPEYAIGIEQRLRKFCKETRQTRFKAYARGCLDVMERYSAAAVQSRSKLKEAPKDVQCLEFLRPASQPSMRERLEAMIAKERKASTHLVSNAVAAQKRVLADEEDEVEEKPVKSKQKKKRRMQEPGKKPTAAKSPVSKAALDEEDEVREGVDDWSDED